MTNGEGTDRQAPSGENNGGAADPATQAVARARVSRRQRKAAVTRLLGSIDASVVENNTGAVKQKLEQIKVTFSNLEAAHDAYHAMLVDDDDIAESEEWFISAQRNYVQSVKSFNQWLESRSNVNPPMSDSGANSDIHDDMCKMMSMMSLPSVQIDKYSGDPLHYQAFICIFDEVVASKDIDDQIRLTRLLQYTEGEAKNAIKNCALVGGSAGYKQARDILSSRFGDPHIISQSIMRDLKSGKSISKNSDLQQLADELTMARTALKKLGMTSEIDNQKSILEILQRCPRYIMNKWRIKALEHKRDKDKYPGFDDFVDFISLKALDACDPVYGQESFRQQPSKHKGASFTGVTRDVTGDVSGGGRKFVGASRNDGGNVESASAACVVCSRGHRLFQCNDFKAMSPRDRLNVAMRNKLCFNCLMNGHFANRCPKESVCSVPDCGMKHTKFVHIDKNRSSGQPVGNSDGDSAAQGPIIGCANVFGSRVYLPVVPVIINGSHCVYALLDSGSTNTFVSRDLASEMNLKGSDISYRISTLARNDNFKSKVVSVVITSVTGEQYKLNDVLVTPRINARFPAQEIDTNKYSHLADLPLTLTGREVKADLIIGMDNAHLLAPQEVRRSSNGTNEPYAVRTALGWALNGPVDGVRNEVISNFVNVGNAWSVDADDDDIISVGMSPNDMKVIDLWNNSCVLENGHYILPIPWVNDRPCFPDNQYSALHRLHSLKKRLVKKGQYEQYDENISKFMDKGYAEKVPEEEMNIKDGSVWYLPHHGVSSESKPKVRVVFDCAAQHSGICLNNQALQGPDLVNKLLGVLLRFRQYRYAIMSDVESMYLQVRVPERDRNALRFLWFEGESIAHYRMTSHLFGGVWCAASSTYALRQTTVDFPTSYLVKDTITNAFYVDDMLQSVSSYEEASEVMAGTKDTLIKGGFNLTKFVCNDLSLLEQVPVDDRASEVKEILPEMYSKTLGIQWDIPEDAFCYVGKSVVATTGVTRRMMLSQVSQMYDPLGLISPVIQRGKLLFQEATRMGLLWDDPIPEGLQQSWVSWLRSLSGIEHFRFPRCLVPGQFLDGPIEIHHFCDASLKGFGACSYIRIVNHHGEIQINLILGKGRLAPIKQVTVPRLELCAAVEAVKLDCIVRHYLDIQIVSSTFWTDSQIVLSYIRSQNRRFKIYVANRVAMIRRSSSPDQWRHVSGDQNPADVVSRGCAVSDFPDIWLNGPGFLRMFKCDWYEPPASNEHELDGDPDVYVLSGDAVCTQVCTAEGPNPVAHPMESLIQHYSCYYKLKKAVAWWLRLVKYLRLNRAFDVSGPLKVPELHAAESAIIRHVQRREYPRECEDLALGNGIQRNSKIFKLLPMMEDGIIVVGGRLKYAALTHRSKHPIILPHNHKVSRMIVQDYHGATHLGTEWTLSQVRGKFWITKARNIIKSVKRKCVTCRKLYGQPGCQKMADLPSERVVSGKGPFTYVGLDLFGPFYVKSGRSEVKRYGCLFTCYNTRAVHIEVLPSLETDTFINGFIRFIARRGNPEKLWSDQGTNLVGARTELSRSLRQIDSSKVVQVARRKGIDWSFNPPLASHQGGVWERIIRTIRKVLLALLTSSPRMTDDVLHTVLCEVESIINSRPITKSSDDINDDRVLTPNHLLLIRGNMPLPWGDFQLGETYRKQWKYVQHITTQFWRQWLRAYLPQLQMRPKWVNTERNLRNGDIVLLMDENTPRGAWPLGLITGVKEGRDGLVRSATVKTKSTSLVRPVTKMVFIEGSV